MNLLGWPVTPTGAGRLLNGNLGLICEHFDRSPTIGQSACSSRCSSHIASQDF